VLSFSFVRKVKKERWWHLRKIKEGAYPAELLPDYLGEVYEKWLKTKFGK